MKKINLATAIYGLVTGIIMLFAPLFTAAAIVSDVVSTSGTSAKGTVGTDLFFRIAAFILIALSVYLIVKVKQASTAGKVLNIVGGSIVVIFSSLLGFVGGVLMIVGSSLLLAGNKKIEETELN